MCYLILVFLHKGNVTLYCLWNFTEYARTFQQNLRTVLSDITDSFLPSDDILKVSKIKPDQVKSYSKEQNRCESYQKQYFWTSVQKQKRAQTTLQRTHKTQWRKCSLFAVILQLLQGIHLQYQGREGGNKKPMNNASHPPNQKLKGLKQLELLVLMYVTRNNLRYK